MIISDGDGPGWTDVLSQEKKPIWVLPTYGLMVADPFIEGTELEMGHIAQSCSVLGFLIHKIVKDRPTRDRLTLFSER